MMLCSDVIDANFTQDSPLAKSRPDLLRVPSANDEHVADAEVKLGKTIDAELINLKWEKVHSTSQGKTNDPDAKIEFLHRGGSSISRSSAVGASSQTSCRTHSSPSAGRGCCIYHRPTAGTSSATEAS